MLHNLEAQEHMGRAADLAKFEPHLYEVVYSDEGDGAPLTSSQPLKPCAPRPAFCWARRPSRGRSLPSEPFGRLS